MSVPRALQCFLYKAVERSPKEKAKLQQEILDYIFENGRSVATLAATSLFHPASCTCGYLSIP